MNTCNQCKHFEVFLPRLGYCKRTPNLLDGTRPDDVRMCFVPPHSPTAPDLSPKGGETVAHEQEHEARA